MIRVSGLRYARGDFQLHVQRFDVKHGEFHVLLGPTGSGKTLLLEYLAGLLPDAEGDIAIDGQPADSLAPEARGISYVAQDLALFPNMTVEQNITFGLKFRPPCEPGILDALIEETGIAPLLARYPVNLSGGEKQRVAIVRALAVQPKVLLLDEPFSSLHASLRLSLWQLMQRLHRELRLSVLMVSHDVEEALALGDVISYIDAGSIRQTSRRKEVYYHPRSLAVARFFGLRNIFSAEVAATENGHLILASERFGRVDVLVSHRTREVHPGQRVCWGIHSEEVTVIKSEREERPRKNLFSGVVTSQVDVGRSRVAQIKLDVRGGAPAAQLELSLPEHAARRLGIESGRGVELQLKPDRIFVIAEREEQGDAPPT